MSVKKGLITIAIASVTVLSLTGCSSSKYQLSSAAQNVQFIDTKPSDKCQFIAKAEGRRNTFFSGTKTHSELMKDAAIDLLNNAATMGGNVVYQAQDASMQYISEIAPTDAIMTGDVYKCPIK